ADVAVHARRAAGQAPGDDRRRLRFGARARARAAPAVPGHHFPRILDPEVRRAMHVDRRDFLRKSLCAALGGAGLYSAFGNLKLISAAAAQRPHVFGDYKALVCVFLFGGNDSFNTVVPASGQARADYVASRGSLAIPAASLHALNPASGGGPAGY